MDAQVLQLTRSVTWARHLGSLSLSFQLWNGEQSYLSHKVFVGIKWDHVGTSLAVQWLIIHLPMQGTQVRSLVWEDPTCCGVTGPVCHNYWTCAIEPACHNCWARMLQLQKLVHLEPVLCNKKKPLQWEARAPQRRVAPAHCNWRKPARGNEDPTQSKIK